MKANFWNYFKIQPTIQPALQNGHSWFFYTLPTPPGVYYVWWLGWWRIYLLLNDCVLEVAFLAICAWARFWLHRCSERLSMIGVVWSSEQLMMREAAAPQRPITYQPLTACGGLSCCAYCVYVSVGVCKAWASVCGLYMMGFQLSLLTWLFVIIYPEYNYARFLLSVWHLNRGFIII